MTEVFVSIGSNIQREKHITKAIRLLCLRYGQLQVSSVYESAAVGFAGNPFYNLVTSFRTRETALELIRQLRSIEDRCGRIRNSDRYSSRTLDLDLLLYGDAILATQDLCIPRPEILTDAFVLGPLAELAGGRRHPIKQQTFQQLWVEHDVSSKAIHPVALDLDEALSCSR